MIFRHYQASQQLLGLALQWMLQPAEHQGGTLISHFQEVFKYLVASSVHSHVRDLESEGINEGTDPTWFLGF